MSEPTIKIGAIVKLLERSGMTYYVTISEIGMDSLYGPYIRGNYWWNGYNYGSGIFPLSAITKIVVLT